MTRSLYIGALALLVAGCSNRAVPDSLIEAETLLAASDAAEVGAAQAGWMDRAKHEAAVARRALADGRNEEATLRGHLARQYANIARDLDVIAQRKALGVAEPDAQADADGVTRVANRTGLGAMPGTPEVPEGTTILAPRTSVSSNGTQRASAAVKTALAAAEEARFDALARKPGDSRLAEGTAILESAERAWRRGDAALAVRRAERAERHFQTVRLTVDAAQAAPAVPQPTAKPTAKPGSKAVDSRTEAALAKLWKRWAGVAGYRHLPGCSAKAKAVAVLLPAVVPQLGPAPAVAETLMDEAGSRLASCETAGKREEEALRKRLKALKGGDPGLVKLVQEAIDTDDLLVARKRMEALEAAAKPEPTKVEPEPTKVEPEPAKVEPVKTEPAKIESVKTEPVKTEPVKTEPEKTEPAKVEPVKTEPAKTVPAKTEPVKVEPEPVKVEPEKAEPAKTEPAKTEPAKTEPAKTEPAKTEPAKTVPAKTAPVKVTPPKTEPAKSEPAKALPETPKPAVPTANPQPTTPATDAPPVNVTVNVRPNPPVTAGLSLGVQAGSKAPPALAPMKAAPPAKPEPEWWPCETALDTAGAFWFDAALSAIAMSGGFPYFFATIPEGFVLSCGGAG